jgi:hypothetical protein
MHSEPFLITCIMLTHQLFNMMVCIKVYIVGWHCFVVPAFMKYRIFLGTIEVAALVCSALGVGRLGVGRLAFAVFPLFSLRFVFCPHFHC